MKKHLANIISTSRVVGAIILFFFKNISATFLTIYLLCGFTDLIDGPIARKTNTSSTLGATLDTVGDVTTYLALTKILIKNKLIPNWILVWFINACVLFVICAFVSQKRFKKLYLPHTYLGKVFGGVIFVLPVAIKFLDGTLWLALICTIASIHVIELFIIQSKNNEAADFIPTVFHIKKIKSK